MHVGHAFSTPFPAFLQVPLPWFNSTTYAYYPDESHGSIRRVFSPQNAQNTKRHFCGFCGTPLTFWSEETPEQAQLVCISLGTLKHDSMETLEDLGILEGDDMTNERDNGRMNEQSALSNTGHSREIQGSPWFEDVVQGSRLGQLRTTTGGRTSADGSTKIRWEVVEFGGEDDTDSAESGLGTGKRKLVHLGVGEDVEMRSG